MQQIMRDREREIIVQRDGDYSSDIQRFRFDIFFKARMTAFNTSRPRKHIAAHEPQLITGLNTQHIIDP